MECYKNLMYGESRIIFLKFVTEQKIIYPQWLEKKLKKSKTFQTSNLIKGQKNYENIII